MPPDDPMAPSAGGGPRPAAPAARGARTRRAWVFRLGCLGMAFVVALVLGEVAVRIAAPQALSGAWRDWSEGGYPVNRAGATARHQLGDRVVVYRFDDLGLRGGPLDPSAVRVLCLGDSFTFGWLVDEPDTYLGRMQADADARFGAGRVQFVNGAAGGWNTAVATAFLEDRGDEIRPHAVLCFLNCWDIGRSMSSGLYDFAPGSRTELVRRRPDAPVSQSSRVLSSVPGYGWLLEHSHLVQFLRNAAVRATQEAPRLPPADTTSPADPRAAPSGADAERDRWATDLGRALFLRLRAWCDARSVPLWVVTTGRPDTTPEDGRGTPSGHLEATMAFKAGAAEFFKAAGIPYADIAPQVSAACDGNFRRLQIPGDGHPDEEGCRVIGRFAWEAIAPRLAPLVEAAAGPRGPADSKPADPKPKDRR